MAWASRLQPLLTMSRGCIPWEPDGFHVERDSEIESEQHIVIEVDVTGWSVDDMFSAWNRWSEDFCRICPPENSVVFQIRLVPPRGQTEFHPRGQTVLGVRYHAVGRC